ncbi:MULTISPECIES: hypothetical protein [unclassified Endozoicomonas]|uniref:hypothetical protein n=1 Tax=unclassified Endozoicomonas TaxID=2644528 RepID=UPI003BB7C969
MVKSGKETDLLTGSPISEKRLLKPGQVGVFSRDQSDRLKHDNGLVFLATGATTCASPVLL